MAKKNNNQASLLLHAIVDNLDNSHFNYDGEKGELQFNAGKVARNSHYSHIDFVIRKSNEEAVKPAKRKNADNFAVVVHTRNFPAVKDVDEFLESSSISVDVINSISKILAIAPSSTDDDDNLDNYKGKTDYEKEKFFNKREVFEEVYQRAVKKMTEKVDQLKKTVQEFENKIQNSGLSSRKATYKLAIKNIKKDMIGENASQFKSIFMQLVDEVNSEFRESLDAENRKRLNSRIEQFYSEIA